MVVADPSSPETTVMVFPWSCGFTVKPVARFTPDAGEAAPLIAAVAEHASVAVPEGGAAGLRVRLSARPAADVTVVPRAERFWDADLAMRPDQRLVFTPLTWDAWQTVEFTAAEDDDAAEGRGVVVLEGKGLLSAHACVVERERSVLLTTFPGLGGLATTPAGRTPVARGRPIAIKAAAAPGYAFDRWAIAEGTPEIADATAAETTITLDAAAGIRALYVRRETGTAR